MDGFLSFPELPGKHLFDLGHLHQKSILSIKRHAIAPVGPGQGKALFGYAFKRHPVVPDYLLQGIDDRRNVVAGQAGGADNHC